MSMRDWVWTISLDPVDGSIQRTGVSHQILVACVEMAAEGQAAGECTSMWREDIGIGLPSMVLVRRCSRAADHEGGHDFVPAEPHRIRTIKGTGWWR